MNNSNQIAESLLEAMRTLVDKSVADAGFDRTVEAQIISYEDSKAGKYKIKYQGEYFYAYSDNTEVVYKEGTSVYVLFPGNDNNAQKTIVGSVKTLGTSYVSLLSEADKYIDIGTNVVINYSEEGYSLCSYHKQVIELYKHGSSASKIEIDDEKIKSYLSDADGLRIKADIRTNLPVEQQTRGNYGISIFIRFKSDTDKEEVVLKEYKIDVNNISGNPYALAEFSTQELLQEFDSTHYMYIDSILLYTEDFPNQTEEQQPDDIFIKNFEIYLTNMLSEEELNGYYLKLITPLGTTITNGQVLKIKAQALLKGQEILHTNKDEYYWFVKNPSVAPDSLKYHQKGGIGWECLNTFQVTEVKSEDELSPDYLVPVAGVFQPTQEDFEIKPSMAMTYRTEFKCVAIVDGTVLTKTFTIFNDDCDYSFSIFSSSNSSDIHKQLEAEDENVPVVHERIDDKEFQSYLKNYYNVITADNKSLISKLPTMKELNNTYEETVINFINGVGYADLVCSFSKNGSDNFTEEELENFVFIWSITDINGRTNIYKDTLSEEINDCLSKIDAQKAIINLGEAGTIEPAREALKGLEVQLSTLRSQLHVEKNRLFPVSANMIANTSVFTCGVYDKAQNLLGSASKKFVNQAVAADYTLIINNGTQAFQYNEAGIAPTSSSLKNPLVLNALSFDVVDKNGNYFSEQTKKSCDIIWSIPKNNTMLRSPIDKSKAEETDDAYLYADMLNFDYGIADIYDVNKCINQNITLTVSFKDYVLKEETKFSFSKSGEPGTNGTEFIAKLVPADRKNIIEQGELDTLKRNDYILLKKTRIEKSEGEDNIYSLKEGVRWALPELYRNGELIFDAGMLQPGNPSIGTSIENKPVKLKWSILRNKYAAGVEDFQPFAIDENSGNITINKEALLGREINVINLYGRSSEDWTAELDQEVKKTKVILDLAKNELDACKERIAELTKKIADEQDEEQKAIDKKELKILQEETLPQYIADFNKSEKAYNKAVSDLESFENYKKQTLGSISSSLATLIKVEITYEGLIYSDIIPVMIVDKLDIQSTLEVELDNGGFLYGVYSSDGRRSSYDTAKPFTIAGTVKTEKSGEEITENFLDIKYVSEEEESGNKIQPKYSTIWDTIGTVAQKFKASESTSSVGQWHWVNKCSLELEGKNKNESEKNPLSANEKWIKTTDTYDGECVTNMVRIVIKDNELNKDIAVCYIPVYLLLNKYGNSAINGWDGNSIELNEDSGVILAPQMGAGRKESDNSFTGVVMGTENVAGAECVGLLGYNHGERTIFLDAESGKAEFGKNNGGKIILDPSSDKAQIYSGNYSPKEKWDEIYNNVDSRGMLIDFTTPYIDFGDGAFHVSPKGAITATAGQIGGWDIGENELTSNKGNVGMRAYNDTEKEKGYAFWAGSDKPEEARFRVQYDGSTVVENLRVASEDSRRNRVVIDNGAVYSEKYNSETGEWIPHDTYASNNEGFYLGADGISLGGAEKFNNISEENETCCFKVNDEGEVFATSGFIGGWGLTASGLSCGKSSFSDPSDGIFMSKDGIIFGNPKNEDGTRKDPIVQNKNGVFSVKADGELYAINGLIGGWTLTPDSLTKKDKGNDLVGLSSKNYDINEQGETKFNNSKPAIWAGSLVDYIIPDSSGKEEKQEKRKFLVDFDGNMYANNAWLKGGINASYGTIGGWQISNSYLKNGGIQLDSSGSIKHTGNNWSINGTGDAIFNNITCCGTFYGGTSGGSGPGGGGGGGTLGGGGYSVGGQTVSKDGIDSDGATIGPIVIGLGYKGSGFAQKTTMGTLSEEFNISAGGGSGILSISAQTLQTKEGGKIYSSEIHGTGTTESQFIRLYAENFRCKNISVDNPPWSTIEAQSNDTFNNNSNLMLLSASASVESYITDCGTGQINEDGRCYIAIDPQYEQCVESLEDTIVFLTKYGEGDIYFDYANSINQNYLLIKGTPNLIFSWELKMRRKDVASTERFPSDSIVNDDTIYDKQFNYDYANDIDTNNIIREDEKEIIE